GGSDREQLRPRHWAKAEEERGREKRSRHAGVILATSDLLISPGFSESMRKLHEPCGARLVADVAHALLRAVSRLISTPALLFDTVCESCARTGVEKSLDAARRSAC